MCGLSKKSSQSAKSGAVSYSFWLWNALVGVGVVGASVGLLHLGDAVGGWGIPGTGVADGVVGCSVGLSSCSKLGDSMGGGA